MWETQVWSLSQEDALEKEMATHSIILAWQIPWMEGPGRLQSMWSQRVGHNWATNTFTSILQSKHLHSIDFKPSLVSRSDYVSVIRSFNRYTSNFCASVIHQAKSMSQITDQVPWTWVWAQLSLARPSQPTGQMHIFCQPPKYQGHLLLQLKLIYLPNSIH